MIGQFSCLSRRASFFLSTFLPLIGYFSRTHSLGRLLDEAAEVFREVSGFRERFRDKLGVLEDAYIASRYLARGYMKGGVEGLFVVFEEL